MAPLLPRSAINPIFFLTGFPTLIIGTIVLCVYSIREINPEVSPQKQPVAVLLAAGGFAYQVVGAWPLGTLVNFPWEWQKQIMQNGAAFTWILYLLSLVALAAGGISVFIHSRIWHQKHPEISIN